jgi:hypothetical protein
MLPILSAAFIAAGCTLAFAQGDTATKPGTGIDADKNPTGMHANPTAGNTAAPAKHAMHQKRMKSSAVSAKHHAKPQMPADGAAK